MNTRGWSGNLAFGEAWIAFRGQHSDNRTHAHAALQIVVAAQGNISVVTEAGETTLAPGIAIRSGCLHRLMPGEQCTILLLEPQSHLAAAIQARSAAAEVCVLLPELTEALAGEHRPLAESVSLFRILAGDTVQAVDRRLLAAVEWIADPRQASSVATAASRCGLSPARLRALANEQLGVPLAKMVLWRKVKAASQVLLGGASLAEAAAAAGFADQAHLTRTMANVLGITPGMAKEVRR